jgi:hypothetical protein
MTMTHEQKLLSIEAIASVLAEHEQVESTWSEVRDDLLLEVQSGKKRWAISSRLVPGQREKAERHCLDYLLRKMAFAAAMCPSCLGEVRRATPDAKTNRIAPRRYRCPKCLHHWTDS